MTQNECMRFLKNFPSVKARREYKAIMLKLKRKIKKKIYDLR